MTFSATPRSSSTQTRTAEKTSPKPKTRRKTPLPPLPTQKAGNAKNLKGDEAERRATTPQGGLSPRRHSPRNRTDRPSTKAVTRACHRATFVLDLSLSQTATPDRIQGIRTTHVIDRDRRVPVDRFLSRVDVMSFTDLRSRYAMTNLSEDPTYLAGGCSCWPGLLWSHSTSRSKANT